MRRNLTVFLVLVILSRPATRGRVIDNIELADIGNGLLLTLEVSQDVRLGQQTSLV